MAASQESRGKARDGQKDKDSCVEHSGLNLNLIKINGYKVI